MKNQANLRKFEQDYKNWKKENAPTTPLPVWLKQNAQSLSSDEGFTYKEIAYAVGVSKATLSGWFSSLPKNSSLKHKIGFSDIPDTEMPVKDEETHSAFTGWSLSWNGRTVRQLTDEEATVIVDKLAN